MVGGGGGGGGGGISESYFTSLSAENSNESVVRHLSVSHFLLLLRDHWTNYYQTWHTVSLSKGDSNLLK